MNTFYFTVTLKPIMYKMDVDRQYDETANELTVYLKSISEKLTIVAELTKSMNIHFHGIMETVHTKRQFINAFRNDKKFGFVQCTVMNNYEKCCEYIGKDIKETTEVVGRRAILIDNFSVFETGTHMLYARSF